MRITSLMEMFCSLCEGGTVLELIAESGKFLEKDCAKVIQLISEALAHCHLKGVIHRFALALTLTTSLILLIGISIHRSSC